MGEATSGAVDAAALLGAGGPAQRVLVNCSIAASRAEPARRDAGVWVRDGRIAAVGAVDDVLDEAGRDAVEVRDLGGAWVAPGLVNMHCHLGANIPGTPEAVRRARENRAGLAMVMALAGRRSLHAGVTTVRLCAEGDHVDFDLRRSIELGETVGPRIFTAGMGVGCTGGHGTPEGPLGSWNNVAQGDGVEGIRRVTRQQLKAGADFVKVMASGGTVGEHEQIVTGLQLEEDELEAAIRVAHAWGRKATAHSHTLEATRTGVALGLDCVEHGTRLDDATAREMAQRGVWLVPTLSVTRCQSYLEDLGVPPHMSERALAMGPEHEQSFRRALAHGVRVAVGTDLMPYDPLDDTTATVREAERFAEYGMSDLDALHATTAAGLEWLGADGELGAVAAGMHADLIAMPEDPSRSIEALRGIAFVMKGGMVVRDELRDASRG